MLKQSIVAIAAGVIGGVIPNTRSNIHPLLLGFLLALLLVKLIFGDFDVGYQWSISDILFLIVIGGCGAVGAALINAV